jgi:hypothetical protein
VIPPIAAPNASLLLRPTPKPVKKTPKSAKFLNGIPDNEGKLPLQTNKPKRRSKSRMLKKLPRRRRKAGSIPQ